MRPKVIVTLFVGTMLSAISAIAAAPFSEATAGFFMTTMLASSAAMCVVAIVDIWKH